MQRLEAISIGYVTLITVCSISFSNVEAGTLLIADGNTDTYQLINQVFGGTGSALEVPDCNHTSFGPHITQVFDDNLERHVFAVHSHIREDDDRCQKFDRQRTEIKTNNFMPNNLVGFNGDRVTLSWNFKLDSEFLPPYSFCHIHQLKAVEGDDSMPLITITPRKSTPNELQVLHYDSTGKFNFLITSELDKFLGIWVHAFTEVQYDHNGTYYLELSNLLTQETLLSYRINSIDLWRNETEYIRPKWGLYRSVQEAVLSRDEIIIFDSFCVSKGNQELCE